MKTNKKFETVDEYLAALPESTKSILEAIRETIKAAAPDAAELISYNMPAFKGRGILVYYAAAKNHIGFYPTSSPIEILRHELTGYDTSRGVIRFPFNKPIDHNLISKIVNLRVMQDSEKAKQKI